MVDSYMMFIVLWSTVDYFELLLLSEVCVCVCICRNLFLDQNIGLNFNLNILIVYLYQLDQMHYKIIIFLYPY